MKKNTPITGQAAFNRNVLAATGAGIAASLGCSELTEYLFDNTLATTVAASLSHMSVFASVYLPLHYRTRRELFEQGKSYWKEIGTFYVSALPGTLIYYSLFGMCQNKLLHKSYSPVIATMLAHLAAYVPAQATTSLIAQRMGIVGRPDISEDSVPAYVSSDADSNK